MELLVIYLAAVNLAGFWMMAADKRKALNSRPRISEKSLFTVTWIGGSLGVYIGVFACRHKTRRRAFTAGIPFIMAAQCAVIFFLYHYLKAL